MTERVEIDENGSKPIVSTNICARVLMLCSRATSAGDSPEGG